ncbi:MAG TPA: TadE/TadG family type IV pilus assembly protein [Candidatus Limnocylindria bacterium]
MPTRLTFADDSGQSLVEFALALPLLLVILLGVADLGRAFYYSSAIANAARVGAAYAAADASATASSIATRVCNETGFVPYSATAACPGLATTATFGGGNDAVVTVTYDFDFWSAYLVNRVFHVNPLVLRASATFPSLQ